MPAWLFVVLGLVLVAGGLVAVDWFTAGRAKRRILMRARDGSATDAGVAPADSTGNPLVSYWPGGTRSSFPAGARCR